MHDPDYDPYVVAMGELARLAGIIGVVLALSLLIYFVGPEVKAFIQ